MKLRVTEVDIEQGLPMDTDACPIAHALRRRGFTDVHVGRRAVIASRRDPFLFREYMLPDVARQFIRRFDQNREVRPATFDLKEIK